MGDGVRVGQISKPATGGGPPPEPGELPPAARRMPGAVLADFLARLGLPVPDRLRGQG